MALECSGTAEAFWSESPCHYMLLSVPLVTVSVSPAVSWLS